MVLRRIAPVFAASIILTGILSGQAPSTPAGTTPPNIIIFEPDDLDTVTMQTALQLGLMPNTQKYIIGPGTSFSNYYVSDSHGCPTRESYFFGLYYKNILGNASNHVCSAYQAGGVTPLAGWLKAAGYTTSLFGKYSDGYGYEDLNQDGQINELDAEYIPPSWDYWYAIPYYQAVVNGNVPPNNGIVANDNPNEYNYYLNENGTLRYFGTDPNDYQADVLNNAAVTYLNSAAKSGKPLFLLMATGAPHVETDYDPDPLPGYENIYSYTVRPAPRYVGTVNTPLPEPPSFDDPNVTGKPSYITSKPLMNSADISGMDGQWTNRLEALRGVDDVIGAVMSTLISNGMTNNIVMFMSDNGWMYGFDRLGGKLTPYDPSIGTPLYVNIGGGVTSSAMIIDNDIAATIVDMAGATPGYALDGTSFRPLLANPTLPWRNRYFAQYVDDGLGTFDITPYDAVRTSPVSTLYPNQLFVEYTTGETELYDYTVDPNAMTNQAGTRAYAAEQKSLGATIKQLKTCTGATCHTLEFQ